MLRTISFLSAFLVILCTGAGIGFASNWNFSYSLPSKVSQPANIQSPDVTYPIATVTADNPSPPSEPASSPPAATPAPPKETPAITTPPTTAPPVTSPPATSTPGIQMFRTPSSLTAPGLPRVPSTVPLPEPVLSAGSDIYIKPVLNIADLERQVHNLINIERQKNGLPSLSLDNNLSLVARKHSEDMARRNYFDHVTPEGYNPGDRYKQDNYTIRVGWAENIFKCTLAKTLWYRNGVLAMTEYNQPSEIAALAVSGWMNSPGHRANILTNNLSVEGIGIGISADDYVYITEDFA